ncbi:MAG TPA: arylesterase [Xanthobacteraceae bacterium]|nr:arylesterase [Xanthobacteraceae bacterium]
MPPSTYGRLAAAVQMRPAGCAVLALLIAVLGGFFGLPSWGAEGPVRIVALGDSLTAGFGLPAEAAFPVRLEKALNDKGLAVEIANAGVSGDTMSGGLDRLDWSVPEGTEAVILELGANDMLRGLDPQVTNKALAEILRRLSDRHIDVLLCGMLAAPNLGADYAASFNRIYPDAAAARHLLLYPFFLEGVAGHPDLIQRDGLHPTAAGVDVIVAGILPKAEELVAQVRSHRS